MISSIANTSSKNEAAAPQGGAIEQGGPRSAKRQKLELAQELDAGEVIDGALESSEGSRDVPCLIEAEDQAMKESEVESTSKVVVESEDDSDSAQPQPSSAQQKPSRKSPEAPDDGDVCDICGDSGIEEMLAVCTECKEGAEHLYCMRVKLLVMPEDFLCETCKIKRGEPVRVPEPATKVPMKRLNQRRPPPEAGSLDILAEASGKVTGGSFKTGPSKAGGSGVAEAAPALSKGASFKGLKPTEAAQNRPLKTPLSANVKSREASPLLKQKGDVEAKKKDAADAAPKATAEVVEPGLSKPPKPPVAAPARSSEAPKQKEDIEPKKRDAVASEAIEAGQARPAKTPTSALAKPGAGAPANPLLLKQKEDVDARRREAAPMDTSEAGQSRPVKQTSSSIPSLKDAGAQPSVEINEARSLKPPSSPAVKSSEFVLKQREEVEARKRDSAPAASGEVNGSVVNLRAAKAGASPKPKGGPKEEMEATRKEGFPQASKVFPLHKVNERLSRQLSTTSESARTILDQIVQQEQPVVTPSEAPPPLPAAASQPPPPLPASLPPPLPTSLPPPLPASSPPPLPASLPPPLPPLPGPEPPPPIITPPIITPVVQPAVPAPQVVWRGGFEVSSASGVVVYEGLQAQPSNKASPKVLEASKSLSSPLKLQEFGRATSWPKKFVATPPNDQDIALYFFPQSDNTSSYTQLLDRMESEDLGLKSLIDNAELLVFSSLKLSHAFRCWGNKKYLWGCFVGRKNAPAPPPPPSSGAPEKNIVPPQPKLPEPRAPEINGEKNVGAPQLPDLNSEKNAPVEAELQEPPGFENFQRPVPKNDNDDKGNKQENDRDPSTSKPAEKEVVRKLGDERRKESFKERDKSRDNNNNNNKEVRERERERGREWERERERRRGEREREREREKRSEGRHLSKSRSSKRRERSWSRSRSPSPRRKKERSGSPPWKKRSSSQKSRTESPDDPEVGAKAIVVADSRAGAATRGVVLDLEREPMEQDFLSPASTPAGASHPRFVRGGLDLEAPPAAEDADEEEAMVEVVEDVVRPLTFFKGKQEEAAAEKVAMAEGEGEGRVTLSLAVPRYRKSGGSWVKVEETPSIGAEDVSFALTL